MVFSQDVIMVFKMKFIYKANELYWILEAVTIFLIILI